MVLAQPRLRSQADAALLGRRHRGGCATKREASAITNLDKDGALALGHDQIDFAQAAIDLTVDQAQAPVKQVS
jgi:hypothetical protein